MVLIYTEVKQYNVTLYESSSSKYLQNIYRPTHQILSESSEERVYGKFSERFVHGKEQ